MGTLLDLASLVVVPSGYKEDKIYSVVPTDGSGDLDFTRASNATRVNSAGLIEKVRTNLLTYSQDFSNAAWDKSSGATLTHSQIDPNGGTTASRLQLPSGASNYLNNIISGVANGGKYTHSIYMKSNTGSTQTVRILDGVRGVAGGILNASVTTSWQRFEVIITTASTSAAIQIDNSGGSYDNDILVAFAQTEESDFGATDYIPTTSSAVSVGMTADVPRLDYTNSSCPSLLLEPQRTNLVTYSEQFDNAAWIKTASTITANNSISPDGYTNADLILETTATSNHATVSDLISFVSGTTYTMSVFAKNISGGRGFVQVGGYQLAGTSQDTFANFNLDTGVVTQQTLSTAKIENYGNGWYRCSVTFACTNTISERLNVTLIDSGTAGFSPSYTGDSSKGLLIWGAMMEAGSYATSYIPSLSTSVTRVQDAASKTSATALIGQTEGTIYWEGSITGIPVDQPIFGVEKQASSFVIRFGGDGTSLYAQAFNGSTNLFFQTTTPSVGQKIKLAFAYKAGDYAFYKNGTLVAAGTDATTIPTCDKLQTNVLWSTSGGIGAYNTNQALLFKTRLSNTELAQITTL